MFRGSMVALVTPMKASGEVDFQALGNLADLHLANGTDALVILGTTGETPTLDYTEQTQIIKAVVRQVAGRLPVIVGTGANATRKTVELTENALGLGADACLIVTPYYNKPTQEGLYQHYKTIAEAVPIPQILYNVPGRTGCDLLPETVERLAKITNIIGIKEGNPQRTRDIIQRCQGQLDVFSADDITALEIILQGGKGVISVSANIMPQAVHDCCTKALNGDIEEAKHINERLIVLHKNMFVESNPIPVKWAMHQLGLIPEGIRLPLTPLAQPYHEVVRTALQQAGVFEVYKR